MNPDTGLYNAEVQDAFRITIAALRPNNIAVTRKPVLNARERRMQELEELYLERSRSAQRALDALNRQLDYLTKKHSIREAKSIKILTILASLYLPFSLSAAILGIQNPFRAVAHTITPSDNPSNQDLIGTNLLFDFFGVFIALATCTIFILFGIRLGLWLKSQGLGMLSKNFSGPFSVFDYGKRWRFGGKKGRIFDVIRCITAWWIGGGICITLLTIFMVGMLRTAQRA